MNELARVERVEGEQQGTLCLVRVHGEVDLSNAQEVSSAIGNAMGQRRAGSSWISAISRISTAPA